MSVTSRSRQSWIVLLLATILLLMAHSAATATEAPPVTVYYFHGTTRCDGCLEIEWFSSEILHMDFSQELAEGRLLWRPVNVDLLENTHFVSDFDLTANELVVVRDHQRGKDDWAKLSEIWKEIRTPERFRATLGRMVRQALLPGH